MNIIQVFLHIQERHSCEDMISGYEIRSVRVDNGAPLCYYGSQLLSEILAHSSFGYNIQFM